MTAPLVRTPADYSDAVWRALINDRDVAERRHWRAQSRVRAARMADGNGPMSQRTILAWAAEESAGLVFHAIDMTILDWSKR